MFDGIVGCLPERVGRELLRIAHTRRGGVGQISEIHITLGRCSSVLIGGERVMIGVEVTSQDMDITVHRVCGGAIYAHRDTISEGYVSLRGGVRVGICGQARYESDRLVGVSEVSSLVFRIPTATSSLKDELFSAWQGTKCGMLIYSPPGVGKTAALRSLVFGLASRGENVALVDERREFCSENFEGLPVDVLSGYRRADGFEIALRTLSPDVIAVDEIGRLEEVGAIMESLGSGVRLAITAHAGSISEIRKRAVTAPLIENGMVDMLVGLSIENGERRIAIEGIENETFRAFCDSDCGARGISGVFEPREEEALRM